MIKSTIMTVTPNFRLWAEVIKEFEGFKNNAYLDSGGVATIGFGSTYNYSQNRKVKMGDVISMNTGISWMEIEFKEVVRLANVYIKQPLNPSQSTAVCDYIYNRGIGHFLQTQLDELINENPKDPRIGKEMRGTGLKDRLGHFLRGLQRRRNCEAYLYETGMLKVNF